MRILLASAAAAAFAFAATPAAAQYGGSAQDQVEGAPAETEAAEDLGAPAPDDQAFAPDVIPDQDIDVDADVDSDVGAVAGKDEDVGGEQYALADVDADLDVDADVDVDVDLDQDDAERSGPGDAYEGVDAAEDDAAPEPEGAT